MRESALAERLKAQGLTLKERLKVYDDLLYRQGMDALEGKLGSFDAQQFLHLYYIRRFMESRGSDYTKWHEENDPWEGMTIEEISRQADMLWQRTHGVRGASKSVEIGELVHSNGMLIEAAQ